jgi:DNA mismatch repair protein MutS
LLDEIGRGTSTADGLSIARAVIEYLHNQPRVAAKTLFATHYHELTACSDYLPRVRNFHLAVRERNGKVQYLHRVEEGRAEKSFGIYVAQIAGLPKPVVRRANELLNERDRDSEGTGTKAAKAQSNQIAPEIIALMESLGALDVNEMSPVEALTKLFDLQRRVKDIHKLES